MATQTQPNILFILVDQWRADALSGAGHPFAQTPHLDYLASQGTRFNQAYSSCPVCVAARADLMTGMAPKRTGILTNAGAEWRFPTTLAGTLAAGGYHTQCVGKMHVRPWRNLLGFHNVVLHDGYMHAARRETPEYGMVDDYLPWLREKLGAVYADHNDSGVGCNGYAAQPWPYHEMLHPSSWVTTMGIDFLRRRDPSKPFFLNLSYHRPHPPCDPPASFLDRFRHIDMPPPVKGDWVDFDVRPGSHDSPVPTDPAQIDLCRRAYYAQITHIDYQINRVIMALYERGVLDNTAILFASDHGEMLYDHNQFAKGVPFDASARIPFILRLPTALQEKSQARAGSASEAVVELRDVFPTFCDIAGIETPPDLDGQSVLPLCRCDASGWREYIHGEHAGRGDLGANQWLTDGREKYAWFTQTGRELLFDIAEDPQEMRDLSKASPERTSMWRQRLIDELARRPEGFVKDGALVAGRPIVRQLAHAGVGIEQGAI
ncbi:MAG: arylsulfatase [Puniceicoccaceae bacterium]|nr:MAG: arylsulfatase [Puniceicoccaceae bacterium]